MSLARDTTHPSRNSSDSAITLTHHGTHDGHMRFRWTDVFRSPAYKRAGPRERLLIEIRFALARTLREKRRRLRITQVELAQQLGAAPATISRIERASPHVAMEIFVRAMIVLGADSAEISAAFDAGKRADVQKLRRRDRRPRWRILDPNLLHKFFPKPIVAMRVEDEVDVLREPRVTGFARLIELCRRAVKR